MKMFRRSLRNSWVTKVFGSAVLLLLTMQYGLPTWTTVIDTRVGGAQANLAYVYPSSFVYTMSNQQAFYGDVEFRGGLRTNAANKISTVLGTSTPLAGIINIEAKASQFWIDLKNDLWIGRMDFTTASTGMSVIGFQWGAFDGDTTPYTIFLTRDVTVHPKVWLDLVPYTGNGTFNGRGNTLILEDGSMFTAGSISANANILVENLTIQGAENITSTGSGFGTSYFQNVSLYTTGTGSATLHLNHRSLVYAGLNNIVGGGGIIEFIQTATGYIQLTSDTQLYVSPQTQLKLGNHAVGATQFWFTDPTSILYLDNCVLDIGGCQDDFITFTSGTIYVNGNVTVQANYPGCFLQLGDGVNAANDCNVVVLPGSKLIVADGATLINANV